MKALCCIPGDLAHPESSGGSIVMFIVRMTVVSIILYHVETNTSLVSPFSSIPFHHRFSFLNI